MTKWTYTDPGGTYTISERDILREYYPYWRQQMKKAGKVHLISPRNCIEDFVTIHWAQKVENDTQNN